MKYIVIIILLGMLGTSCANFLKEYSQDQAYIRSYEDLDELLIGETYMETSFGNTEACYFPYIHLMADETKENMESDGISLPDYGQPTKKYFGYITWQYRVGYAVDKLTTTEEDVYWNKLYKHINIANMILDEIDKQKAERDSDIQNVDRIRGEAYFLRAAYYFILANLYCQPYEPGNASETLGIPVKTTYYIEDINFSRGTLADVYKQIIEDLEKAAENLTDIPRKSVFRANISAVRLLQSRVYLYMQNWEKAAEYARLCLDLQDELVDLNLFYESDVFATANSPELIFSMGGNNIPNLLTNLFAGVSVSDGLQKCFKYGDLRSQYFIVYDKEGVPVWDCNKFALQGSGLNAEVSECCLFRTAEAWLNLAEALANQDEEDDARNALDELRKNRISRNNFSKTALTGDALVLEIRDERRRELCFEGHRWFDLRRYTVCENVPFTGSIRNTYSALSSADKISSVSTYELKADDPSWTLQIPYEVVEFEELEPNPRKERVPISVESVR
ncbi:MAG: RagB/SusD family nutrient uptake outer membrane protein [Odoribacter splanchnicus]